MRIALAQIRPKKGDYAANIHAVGAVLAQTAAWPEPAGLVVFGEAVMSGYFLEGGVQEHAISAGTLFRDLAAVHTGAKLPPVDVCVGFYERFQARVFNSALYATLGGPEAGIRHVHRKVFLPTYGLFDEERFVDAGRAVQAFDTAWGRVAMLVCEDAWHSVCGSLAALDGAGLILVPSASPARGAATAGQSDNVTSWDRLTQRMAEEHGVYVALVQLAGSEGGKQFQGCSSLVGPDGAVIVRAPAFDEAVVHGELQEAALRRARAEQPLLADLEVVWDGLVSRATSNVQRATGDEADGKTLAIKPVIRATIPETRAEVTGDPLAVNAALLEGWLVRFLRDELTARGFAKGVVGVSGGADSAVTLMLAARALGAENVVAVHLPYATSSQGSRQHAALAAKAAGVTLETIDMSAAVDALVAAVDPKVSPHRRGNIMARMRMITLFDLAAQHHALPLGTGNKSERLLGYFTWHGDDAPPLNPIGDLYKTQVLALARHLGVPDAIVAKPATADLVLGQTDESDLGITYARADLILHWLLAGFAPSEIEALGFAPAEVTVVRKRLDSTHWKRRLPTVAMVSRSTIGESWLRPVDY